MGTVSIDRRVRVVAVVLGVLAGCAHAPEPKPSIPGDDTEAGLRRDNATLRRRVQMLEDRVLKLERRAEIHGAAASYDAAATDGGPTAVRLDPEQRDPALEHGVDRPPQKNVVSLDPVRHAELDDDRLWSDHSGYAAEEPPERTEGYRLVGRELVRMTEPDRPKPPDRQPTGAKGKKLEARYAAAIELYRAHAYAEAEAEFESIANEFPKSDYADNAWYWKGEAAYDQERFADALAAFTAVVERYGGGNKAPDALLKIGLCYDKLGDRDNARDVLSQLVSAYPGATASDIARARLAELGT